MTRAPGTVYRIRKGVGMSEPHTRGHLNKGNNRPWEVHSSSIRLIAPAGESLSSPSLNQELQ